MHEWLNRWLIQYPGRFTRGENILYHLYKYKKIQWWTKDRIEEYQLKKVKKLIQCAYLEVPFYNQIYKKANFHPSEINTFEDLTKVPIITRHNMMRDAKLMKNHKRNRRNTLKITGGSTAQPAKVYKNRRATAQEDAAMWRALSWWEINVGDRQARFWGTALDKNTNRKIFLIDYLMNRKRISAMNFTKEKLFEHYEKIKKFQPSYFYGYPSLILDFTKTLEEVGIKTREFDLKAIVATAEPIYDYQIKYLKEAYECNFVNDYGSSELGPIAYLCPNGSMHLMAENLFVEVIDENERVLPGNCNGELIITDLNNFTMPLIRYKTNDYSSILTEECSCGRGLPVMGNITGRILNSLKATDGSYVHGGYLYYIIESMVAKGKGHMQIQAIQDKKNHIRLNIVENKLFQSKEIDYFIKEFKKRLGEDMNFTVQILPELQRERSGKLFITKNLLHSVN